MKRKERRRREEEKKTQHNCKQKFATKVQLIIKSERSSGPECH